MNVYCDYNRTFVPFRLKSEPTVNQRCWIGGAPPLGVMPPRVEPLTSYFATLGLEEGLDVSLFVTFDYTSRHPHSTSFVEPTGCTMSPIPRCNSSFTSKPVFET